MKARNIDLGADDAIQPGPTVLEVEENDSHRPLRLIAVNNRDLSEIAEDCIQALLEQNNPPYLYRRGGAMVRIICDEHLQPQIQEVNESALRGILARSAIFCRLVADRNGSIQQIRCAPPLDVVRDLLALPPDQFPLPPLKGIVRAPVLRPDGSVVSTPGYDRVTSLFYDPSNDLAGLKIPDQPNLADVRLAIDFLNELIADFPFVDKASRASAIALLLTLAIRPLVSTVPLMVLSATQQGSGKTLLAELVSLIYTAVHAILVTAPKPNADEWAKMLAAQLSTGRPLIIFDNLSFLLSSDALASVITSGTYEARMLGRTEVRHFPQQTTIIVTGNNVGLSDDMARRCMWVRLNPQMANPYRRSGFRHSNIREWTRQNRRQLLVAILTIVRGWFVAGQPASNTPVIGSFEQWCRVMGGILAYAGVEGFLENFDELVQESNSGAADWEAFLYAVINERPQSGRPLEATESKVLTSKEILELCKSSSLKEFLPDDLLESVKRESPLMLANQLSKIAERRFGDECIFLTKTGQNRNKVATWQIRIGSPVSR